MISGFLARKKTMTSLFDDKGQRLAVTVLEAKPLTVKEIRTPEKHGYSALQLQLGNKLIEFATTGEELPELKSEIKVDSIFAEGDNISVTGTSKGHGFAGVIKRHNFRRQPVTRGQSDRTRAPGSIGAQTPGKVVKGKKMPGHYGNATATILNLKIVKIDPENNLVYVSGAVPGHYNSWLTLFKK